MTPAQRPHDAPRRTWEVLVALLALILSWVLVGLTGYGLLSLFYWVRRAL